MPITIRPVNLSRDREEVISFLRENLTERSSAARFDWLYIQNPFGEARAWMADDDASGRSIGLAGAFPRSIWFDGKVCRSWILGDFCISTGNRSLGPAVLLQRNCMAALAEERDVLWLDFPSKAMVAVYRRLCIPILSQLVRYVSLLRVDSKVDSFVSQPFLARGVSAVGNFLIRLNVRPPSPTRLELSLHEGSFDDEFTTLDAGSDVADAARGVRSAEYLNWRYRRNPLNHYHVVVARSRQELKGYAVLEANGSEWMISDIRTACDRDIVPAVLGYVNRVARSMKVERVCASISEASPLCHYLRTAGFYKREGVPIIACGAGRYAQLAKNSRDLLLMHGDRES
jgi:hypothetical protein